MPLYQYHNRPTHLAFHDLTQVHKPPPNLRSLLGLGLNFIPTPHQSNNYNYIYDRTFQRIRRSIHLKYHFAGGANETDNDCNPRIYVPTGWTPPPWTFPAGSLNPRLKAFEKEMKKLFKPRRGKPNLLPHQLRALNDLQANPNLLVVPADKNLGPCIIERDRYIRIVMRDHLNDNATYQRLTAQQVRNTQHYLRTHLEQWIKVHKDSLSRSDKMSLKIHMKNNTEPFARFYATLKVHKAVNGRPLTSRPIVSCPGSLLHPLASWVDTHLQKVAQVQRSYFKSSFELKQQLLQLDIPPFRAKLFTADAVSMYTNIPTNRALNIISRYLRRNATRFSSMPMAALIEGLRLVMTNNVFTFGDMTFKQKNGTAMGTPPAPSWANLYFAIHEDEALAEFVGRLLGFWHFIDDIFGIWICHPDPETDEARWQDFIRRMNDDPGLTWIFSERSNQVDFMDLTITLNDGVITTSLYEKPLNLHLCIPAHSAHPPGLLPGVVFGTLFRIQTLCSDARDREQRTKQFFKRLIVRGYQAEKIRPLFQKAIARAQTHTGPTEEEDGQDPFVILHLQCHPQDPPSSRIQQHWRELVSTPQYKMPLHLVPNPKTGQRPNIRRMIIAYSRPMNLGNMLTHRNIDRHQGPPASSYYQQG